MATQTQIQQQLPPDYVQERQKDLLLTLFGQGAPGDSDYVQGLINQPRNIPMQQVAGFTQPQQDAFTLAGQGIGAFQPYITQAGQTAGTARRPTVRATTTGTERSKQQRAKPTTARSNPKRTTRPTRSAK